MLLNLPKVQGSYRENYKLSNVTWFNVGGNADILFKPKSIQDLSNFIKNLSRDIPYFVIGVGSNLLVRDAGIRGIVIRLGREFAEIQHTEEILAVGAGALDVNVSQYCKDNSLTGLEFLSGIPGVIGGALAMNAGAYGKEISDVLIKAEAIDKLGNQIILTNADFGFRYRGNKLDEKIIFTKAYFKVSYGKQEEIAEKIDQIQQQREATQPIRSKTGGSTFKNPAGKRAWELIDQAGCRGTKLGGAMISEKHCNFLINLGGATAEDLEDLGELVRKKVLETSGIELQWEIKIIGERNS